MTYVPPTYHGKYLHNPGSVRGMHGSEECPATSIAIVGRATSIRQFYDCLSHAGSGRGFLHVMSRSMESIEIKIMGSGDRIWECDAQLVISIELCLDFVGLAYITSCVVAPNYDRIKAESIPAWKLLEISFSLQTAIS